MSYTETTSNSNLLLLLSEYCTTKYAQRVLSARSMLGVASRVIKMRGSAHKSLRPKAVTIQNPTGTYASSRPPEKNGGYDGKGTRFAWLHIQQAYASVIISTILMACGSPPQSLRVSARFDFIGLPACMCVRGRQGERRRKVDKAPSAVSTCSYHCSPAHSRAPGRCISPASDESLAKSDRASGHATALQKQRQTSA